jgi:hypothetical protein
VQGCHTAERERASKSMLGMAGLKSYPAGLASCSYWFKSSWLQLPTN